MRIAVVTPLFPTTQEPYRGRPIFESVLALRKYADVSVCSVRGRDWRAPDAAGAASPDASVPADLPVAYFTYPFIPLLTRPWNRGACARRIHDYVRSLEADLILTYWIYPEGSAGVEIAEALSKPAIVSSRGSDLRTISDPFTRRLVAATVRRADYVLAVSNDLRERAVALGASPERAVTLHNGCNHGIFHFGEPRDARRKLGIPDDEKTLLFVGYHSRAKGMVELLGAFSALWRRDPTLRLVCIGAGPLKGRLPAMAASAGVAGRVTLLGEQPPERVAEWMQAADLLCLPSRSEGCPNVLIEALSCGCPVVASNVGGIPELGSESSRILVPAADEAALTAALREGVGRKWDRRAIAAACSRTWDDVARETYSYCEAAARRPIRPARPRRKSGRLKVVVVTSYFPTSSETYRGHSAFHTLAHLKDVADVEVICPLPAYPRLEILRPQFFTGRDRSYKPKDIEATYFEYPVLPGLTRPFNGWFCTRNLLPLLRTAAPDVILNYWLYPDGYSAVQAGREVGAPVIVGSIGSDIRRITDPFTRYFVKRTLAESAAVITVSEELRQQAIALGADAGKVTTVLNGCDTSVFFHGDRDEARRGLGCLPEDEVVLFVGSIIPSKGVAELLDAFAKLAASRPRARLVFIGEGPFAQTLHAGIARLGLQNRVELTGTKSSFEVARWMRACNVFCLPSHSEGCPNVVVEALCSGRAVVASDVGGIPELVDENCGILAPPNNPVALQAALEAALSRPWDEPAIARRLKRGWEEVAADTYAVCQRVYEASRRAVGAAVAR